MSLSDARRKQESVSARLLASPWIARLTEVSLRRHAVTIGLSSDLFSSAGIDVGTLRLLRLLSRSEAWQAGPQAVLDLGCGVGALGIALAADAKSATKVTCIDRDHLAVAVTAWNARQNRLLAPHGPLTVLPAGLDYEPCRAAGGGPFDLIVSNIPAKAGVGGIEQILFGAGSLLKPGGAIAFVHVTPLAETIDTSLQQRLESGLRLDVAAESRGKEHVARIWRLPDGLPQVDAPPLAAYLRSDAPERILLRNMPVLVHEAVHDVDEFDTAHYRTPLLTELIELARPAAGLAAPERVLVLQPAHGFLPAMIVERREPRQIALLSRDTLELAIAARNLDRFLARRQLPTERIEPVTRTDLPWLPAPTAVPEQAFDLIVGPLELREGRAAVCETLAALRDAMHPEGRSLLTLAVASGQVESLRRAAVEVGLRTARSRKRRGHTAVVLRRRRANDPVEDDSIDDVIEDER